MDPTIRCCLLKAICTTLRFPARASTAAHTYLRHYLRHQHLIQPQQQPTDQALLAACVLLASKVEEVPVSNNHLLNVTAVLHDLLVKKHMSIAVLLGGPEDCNTSTQQPAAQPQPAAPTTTSQGGHPHAAPAQGSSAAAPSAALSGHQQQGMAGQAAAASRGHAPEPHNGAGGASAQVQAVKQEWDAAALKAAVRQCSVLVGDTYQHHKTLVLEAEQQLLRLLQWQLLVCQPTAALLQAAAALRVPFALLTCALFVLNDAIMFSDVLLPLPRQPTQPNSHNTGHTTSAAGAVPPAPGEDGTLVHMSETGLHDTRRELLVAAACLVTAADMSAELDLLTCATCRHAIASQAQHRHDGNGAGNDVMGQGMSESIVDGQPRCRHWLWLLGLRDVHAVEQYALYIHQHMRQAQAALKAWEQGAMHA